MWAWAGFIFRLQICDGIRFGGITPVLVEAGANFIVVPALWGRGRLEERLWRPLLTARATDPSLSVRRY